MSTILVRLPARCGRCCLQFAVILYIALVSCASAISAENLPTLRSGWYLWPPYQFEEQVNDIPRLAGLDIKLVSSIGHQAGYAVSYKPISWAQHQRELQSGGLDIAAGATFTAERAAYAYFSEPYRYESNVFYLRAEDMNRHRFNNMEDLLSQVKAGSLRLGVVEGFVYASEKMRTFVDDPANARFISASENSETNFHKLLRREIDGFVIDRVEGAHLAFIHNWQSSVREYPLDAGKVPIHVMFSKKTCTPEMVEAFNLSLHENRKNGKYNKIIRSFMLPLLIAISTGSGWFFALEMIGTVAFAMSGLVIARRERYNLVGALVLAALPAVGGGLIRDLIVGRRPVAILKTPDYLLAVAGVVFAGYLLFVLVSFFTKKYSFRWQASASVRRWTEILFRVFDGIGLSAFTVIGVGVALETNCQPLWLWGPFLAVLTAAGGGIIRDIVRSGVHNPILRTSIYAEIPMFWGLLFSIFMIWQTDRLDIGEVKMGVIITLLGVFVGRMFLISHHSADTPVCSPPETR